MSDVLVQRIGARARVAAHLESEKDPVATSRAFAKIAALLGARHLERPLCLPQGVRVIGVGGATLGGSYKTPFAMALAEKLAALSRARNDASPAVIFVGHAYRARPLCPRVVRPDDDVREVGDDALLAARQLAPYGVRVVVAPRRQAAVDFAADFSARSGPLRGHEGAPVHIVVDGLLQARPHRLARSILVLGEEGAVPAWCPPAGDLRASLTTLRRASDASIVIDDELRLRPRGSEQTEAARWIDGPASSSAPPHVDVDELGPRRAAALHGVGVRPGARIPPLLHGADLEADVATSSAASPAAFRVISRLSRAFDSHGSSTLLADLAVSSARVGLLLAMARPERVVLALARRAVHPRVVLAFGDHDVPKSRELARAASTHRIDVWLTTAKCATKLPAELRGAPILTLEHELDVPRELAVWATGEAPRGQSLPSSPARRA